MIPKSVTSIGYNPISSCPKLKFIEVSSENLNYSNYNSDGILYNKNFTSIICFPAGMTTEYNFLSTITYVGNYSFTSCVLPIINIGENVKTIGAYAFENSLCETINIPNSVTLILENAFSGCSFKSIDIPNSVISIEIYAFAFCNSLENFIFTDSVTVTGLLIFQSCLSLVSVKLSNSMKNIQSMTFSQCDSLETVYIGFNVITISQFAFFNCAKLKCIYFYGENEPEFGISAFSGVPTITVMTLDSYNSDKFGSYDVIKGTTIEGCEPWPTSTFTSSITFSQSNTFTQSNTLTSSFPYGAELVGTISITYTSYNSQSISILSLTSYSFTISMIDSSYTYIDTYIVAHIYLFTNIINYISYYSYYFFFTFPEKTKTNTYSIISSNTFTDTFHYEKEITISLTLTNAFTYQYSFTKTLFTINTVSFSLINMIQTYINTVLVVYDYTIYKIFNLFIILFQFVFIYGTK